MIKKVSSLGVCPDAIIPVPLHPTRERERGFNQATLLAREIAAAVGRPVEEALIRVRPTKSQVGLDRATRASNVSFAFAAVRDFGGRGTAVVVDDVTTSGATLRWAGSALIESGFKQVLGLTMALAVGSDGG